MSQFRSNCGFGMGQPKAEKALYRVREVQTYDFYVEAIDDFNAAAKVDKGQGSQYLVSREYTVIEKVVKDGASPESAK